MDKLHTLQALMHPLRTPGDSLCVLALQKDGVTTWTYGEVASCVQRLAHGLVNAGVKPGEYVPLLATNRPEWLVACLAVITAGAAIVPLDTNITSDALQRILPDSAARFLFTTTDYLNRLKRLDLPQPVQPILLDVQPDDPRGWRCLLADQSAGLPTVTPDDPAAMFYTSGTTGVPKGVPHTHHSLAFQLESVLLTKLVREDDRIMLPLPMYHVYPFTVGTLVPLAFGVPIVLPQSLTGPQIMRALQEGQPTIIVGVPRLYRALYTGIEARVQSSGRVVQAVFSTNLVVSKWLRRQFGIRAGKKLFGSLHNRLGPSLRLLASGGSALDPDLAWNLAGLGWEVAIGYGLTETAPLLTMNLPLDKPKLGSAGKALAGVELRLDTTIEPSKENGDTPPAATTPQTQGEILARGPNVFAGYRNLPEQTAEAFTADGWFRTGDLGYFEDEYLYITGRASTLIVTEGGKNIQPEPVEDVYHNHQFIQEIGILQQNSHLTALIVPDLEAVNRVRNGDVEGAIREAVSEQSKLLPSYQRITDYAITPEPLPKTNLGKIRRHLLVEEYHQVKQGIIQRDTKAVGPIAVEDMSEQDQALLAHAAAREVWDWLASRYPDRRLTPDTSPQLDLGLDSLSWLNLTLDIRQRTGVELSDEAIKRITTVRDLLHEVNTAAESGDTSSALTTALEHPEEVLTAEEQQWLNPPGAALNVLGVMVFLVLRIVMRLLFKLRVRGLENLPDNTPFVLTPNHTSYMDAITIAASLSYAQMRQTYWAGSVDVMFQHPIMRLISRLSQTMPIAGDEVGTKRSSLAFAAITLKRKKNLVWFPEGRISTTGELLPFRQGLGMVLEHHPAAVVPVLIRGTYEALPPERAIPRPHPISITFGKAYRPHELVQQGTGDAAAARMMNALHDQVVELRKQQ